MASTFEERGKNAVLLYHIFNRCLIQRVAILSTSYVRFQFNNSSRNVTPFLIFISVLLDAVMAGLDAGLTSSSRAMDDLNCDVL